MAMINYVVFLIGLFILSFTCPAQTFKVILDTDIDSDVDDAEALAMVHTLADKNKINFLGVVVTSDDPYAAVCVSAINQYYGRPQLPIGVLKNQIKLTNHSRYTRQIAAEFPHELADHQKAEDATILYRQLLSASPDESVIIITIGHLTNFQNLLQSPPDKYSGLTGQELVHKKVAKWLCMGGIFPGGPKEANFYRPDPGSTVYCVNKFQKQTIFAGWEVGTEIITGGNYLKTKLKPKNPVYRAYELYNNFKGRASWDQVAVFLLLNEAPTYFETMNEGYCQVNPDGSNAWKLDRDSNHEYVKFKPQVDYKQIARMMDDLAVK